MTEEFRLMLECIVDNATEDEEGRTFVDGNLIEQAKELLADHGHRYS